MPRRNRAAYPCAIFIYLLPLKILYGQVLINEKENLVLQEELSS